MKKNGDAGLSKKEREKLARRKKALALSNGNISSSFSVNDFFATVGNTVLKLYPGKSRVETKKRVTSKRMPQQKTNSPNQHTVDLNDHNSDTLTKPAVGQVSQRKIGSHEIVDHVKDIDLEASTSSSEHSDNESVASVDSDLAILNAPLLPQWLSWKGIMENVSKALGGGKKNNVLKVDRLDGVVPSSEEEKEGSSILQPLVVEAEEMHKRSLQVIGNATTYVVTWVGMGLATIGGAVLNNLETALRSIADGVIEKKESAPP